MINFVNYSIKNTTLLIPLHKVLQLNCIKQIGGKIKSLKLNIFYISITKLSNPQKLRTVIIS